MDHPGMKILQLTNKVPYPPRDGGAIASLTLARELARAGHDVTMLAMNTSKHFLEPGDSMEREGPFLLLDGFRMETVSVDTTIRPMAALSNLLFTRLPYNAVRFLSEAFRRRLLELLEQETFDYILLDQLYTCLYINDIRQAVRTPLILRAHNIEHEIWRRTARSSGGLQRLYLTILANRIRRFELSVINRYDILVPITGRDAAQFGKMGNQKPMHILPAGMDIPSAAPADTPFTPSVAHLGALDWLPNREGILWFIRNVWPSVREAVPGIEFHLAGRNAPESFRMETAAPGVVYYGEISDAANFIRQHPVFIVPLFSGSGMRIKLLSYLAAGKATVTTTVGAEGIPVTHGRETFIADQPRLFAEHLINLLKNEDLCHETGKQAVDFIRETYDNRKLIAEFLEFLNTLDNNR
jgi:glycosyltransferase involved in cell wall biosynthesis